MYLMKSHNFFLLSLCLIGGLRPPATSDIFQHLSMDGVSNITHLEHPHGKLEKVPFRAHVSTRSLQAPPTMSTCQTYVDVEGIRRDLAPKKHVFCNKWLDFVHLWRPLWMKMELLLALC